MPRENVEERIFNDNLDRLLAGQEVTGDARTSEDGQTALDFARRMTMLRTSPSPQFQANLKARLLQKLNEQEVQTVDSRSWFWRLIPHEPVWQAVAVLAIVAILGGVLWGTLFHPSPSNIANAPQPTSVYTAPATSAAVPAPATSAAPVTSAAPTTSFASGATAPATTAAPAPTIIVSQILKASASTNKSQYTSGEAVNIDLTWQNVTSQTITIQEFPPIVSLMQSSTQQPVYTFSAGTASRTLAPGEKAEYILTWNQLDAKGRHVAAGSYYLELEELYYQGRRVPMTLANPVSFDIVN